MQGTSAFFFVFPSGSGFVFGGELVRLRLVFLVPLAALFDVLTLSGFKRAHVFML